MIDLSAVVRHAKKAAADNTPAILTAIGVSGTVATAVFTGRASFKAAEMLRDAQQPEDELLETKEKIELTWKLYIPAVGTGALTVACIIGANRISTHRSAALAAAYALAQDGFKEYREKVLEKLGDKKEQDLRNEIAQDRVNRNQPPATIIYGSGDVRVQDCHSGRYFRATLESLKKAENDTNYQILHDDYASLTDFWDRLGLEKTSESDEIGWTSDMKLEVDYGSAIAADGIPCITISFLTAPVRGYFSLYN